MGYEYYTDETFVGKLTLIESHLYVRLFGEDWLLDTGAPSSFGAIDSIVINNQTFELLDDYLGLDAEQLSELTKNKVFGLIGVDILNQFYVVMDLANEKIVFSNKTVAMDGNTLGMNDFMGIPIIKVGIDGADKSMFFDTGAQISYWNDEGLKSYQPIDVMNDFYPGFGEFQTNVYIANMALGNEEFSIRCGVLPSMLALSLSMGGTEGIIGNELLKDRVVGYFPKKGQLVIS
ncbi:hypothetical protein MNB_SUP05-10-382 [hydrothermal vent metagenome]|uniref:Peptidase A2 domain-containing protein n=1 Tax=hydrothermal vent metagenome TaxID=652676 RepID=A0A1W1DA01_9ZZZZ